MRIAITADPFIPVPPENYGGIERVIDFLVNGLNAKGHDVLLVAHAESTTKANILRYKTQGHGWRDHVSNIRTIAQLGRFKPDIIHSFSRLTYLLPFLYSRVPKLMSYQREPTVGQIKKGVQIARKNTLAFTGCSDYITSKISRYARCTTVYNGVELDKYRFSARVASDAPLMFLGRLEPIKGIKNAVDVAIAAGRKLIIAGTIPAEYADYFEQEIRPAFNTDIEYIGPVNDAKKNELLGQSAALLMPIEWNEPFGIVMAEALACGTPVIGFNRGSVPEVILHGKNGFRCDTMEEMVTLVKQTDKISRQDVRRDAEARFSDRVIVDEYLEVYQNSIRALQN